MPASNGIALGLGGAALVTGILGALLDVPAFAVVAGVLGMLAVVVVLRAGAGPGHDVVAATDAARLAAEARIVELQAAFAAAVVRADEAEQAARAAEAAGATHDADLAAAQAEHLLDPVTGLYGEPFFGVTLSSRVAAARRHLRPVAIVLMEVAAGVRDGTPALADPAMVSKHVRATLREADTACRLDGNRFALVLEDTPENGAVWTVERVRRALASERTDLTLWAGVACYPAHAFDGGELLSRAGAALEAAKEWRQDRIEVATTSEV